MMCKREMELVLLNTFLPSVFCRLGGDESEFCTSRVSIVGDKWVGCEGKTSRLSSVTPEALGGKYGVEFGAIVKLSSSVVAV